MLVPGLVSIAFRRLSPAEIIGLVREAGLQVIEWGGDVHVPPAAAARAISVQRAMTNAGLGVAAYGSYFSLGRGQDCEPWLETAGRLGAPTIRIWAGEQTVGAAVPPAIADELHRVCDLAARYALSVSLEFHEGTWADSADAVVAIIRQTRHPALRCYWQLLPGQSELAVAKASLQRITPWLTNVHIFNRGQAPGQWQRLARQRNEWRELLQQLGASKRGHATMLEFVEDGSPLAFKEDAATLLSLLEEIKAGQEGETGPAAPVTPPSDQ